MNQAVRDYVIVAVSSLIFGVAVILTPIFFPSTLTAEENIVSDSFFNFYILYAPFYIYFFFKLFKRGVNVHSCLSFLATLLIGTISYSLGLILILSQFSVSNLMMG